jgi:AGCS family alanine or glycine:cation symporter
LGWSHYGSKACEYLFGTKSTIVYKIAFVLMIFIGCTMNLGLAWDLSDTFNGLMAIPNLIGVIALSPVVMKITKNYVARIIKKEDVKPMLSVFPEIQEEQEKAM